MYQQHRLDNRGCLRNDIRASNDFVELALSKNAVELELDEGNERVYTKDGRLLVTPQYRSIGKQDWDEHWDFRVKLPDDSVTLDLKACKRINSKDEAFDDKWILIELQAVKNASSDHRPGWLYGQADYIVFELAEGFVWVPRFNLLLYLEKTFDLSVEPVKSSQDKQPHIIYYRWDWQNNTSRCDKFVYLYKEEVMKLKTAIWRKHG